MAFSWTITQAPSRSRRRAATLMAGKDPLILPLEGVTVQETLDEIKTGIKDRFAKVALVPHGEQPFPIGPASAKRLGYDAQEIDGLPASVTESFAGVGNPLALGSFRAGEIVLDMGSEAGMDSILAARRVGHSGKVIGVDVTEEMIEKATRNAEIAGTANVQFRLAEAEALPVDDGTVDVVTSNGVLNLCLDKPRVLAELFRVLKPGGRVQLADILLDDAVTPEEVAHKGAWSSWIAGAVWGRALLQMLADAGFTEARFHGWTGYRTSSYTQGGLVTARKPMEQWAADGIK